MADRVETFDIATPAGTLSTAPQVTALATQQGRLDRLELTIPAGHAGLTGFALWHSGQQVIPYRSGAFLRGDNRVIGWDLSRYPVGSKWSVRTYNTDVFAHSHLLDLLFTDVLPAEPPAPVVPPVLTGEVSEIDLGESEQLPDELPDQLPPPAEPAPAPPAMPGFPPGPRAPSPPAEDKR